MVRASVPETNDTPLGLDDCECEVRPVKGTKRIVEIVPCPKHAAADDLLAACEAVTAWMAECAIDTNIIFSDDPMPPFMVARAAIARATGGQS